MIPAIIMVVFLGQYVLLAFGKDYSSEGFRFLQILALSGVFVGINAVFGTLFKVKHRVKELFIISILNAIIILGLSYLLIDKALLGIGLAWMIGQGIVSGVYVILSFRRG